MRHAVLVIRDYDNILYAVFAQGHLIVWCVSTRRLRPNPETADALTCQAASSFVVVVFGAAKEQQNCLLCCFVVKSCTEVLHGQFGGGVGRRSNHEGFGDTSFVVAVPSIRRQFADDGLELVGVQLVTQHVQQLLLLCNIDVHCVGGCVDLSCCVCGSFDFHGNFLQLVS